MRRPRIAAARRSIAILTIAAACSSPARAPAPEPAPTAPPAPDVATISIVGTSDLHGHVRALPLLAGYVSNLRRARADDGAVILVDGGDLFQGTLESNLEEGASVVAAYEALGYDAAAIGNHEFDYGPIGERATPREPDDDPRGALRARITEADFPFLAANLLDAASQTRADLGVASATIERAGVVIGVIGVTTETTLGVTLAPNVADLAMRPIVPAVAEEARALRERGADVVIVLAHAGGRCRDFADPDDLSSCETDHEIVEVARALPAGAVDAIVAGHTHQAMAHRVNGIAIVQSWSYGVAFGRVDLDVDRRTGAVVAQRIHPPRRLCSTERASPEGAIEECAPGDYEGAAVEADARIAAVVAPSIERAAELRDRPLGPTLLGEMPADRNTEGALGNLFVDLMLRARPRAHVAIMNGGGLRATLPAGPLRYGSLYEAFPFDNRFAFVRATGADLRAIYASILDRDGSFFSIGGVRVVARCERGERRISLLRANGREVRDGDALLVATSEFLATGGDGIFAPIRARDPGAIEIEDDPPIREAIADVLRSDPRPIDPRAYFDPASPRVTFPGPRPVRCADERR
jgi:5'-nucleotidase